MGPLPLSVSIAPRPSLMDTSSVEFERGAQWVALVCQNSAVVQGSVRESDCLAHLLVFRSIEKRKLWYCGMCLSYFCLVPQGHIGHVEMVVTFIL